jgi:two-component system sensor kinase FixL
MPAILPTIQLHPELSGEVSPGVTGLGTQRQHQATDERVAASLREISGVIAHEIAQPLAAILGDAEAGLRLLKGPGDVRDILEDIISSVQRATEIIERLRVVVHGGELNFEPRSLNAIVTSALRCVSREIGERGIQLQLQLEPDLAWVAADHVQMEQVIVNLLTNACQAMEPTPREQRVLHVVTRTTPDRCTCELAIGDSGTGVAEVDRERIFQPFVTTKPHGLGLGLAISRFIVRAHGGYLWAEAPHRGALFRMGLPKFTPIGPSSNG